MSERKVDFNGHAFKVPSPGDAPFLFWDYVSKNQIRDAIDHLLDDADESRRLWEDARPTMKQVMDAINQYAEEMEADLGVGKSSAPTGSPTGTAGRSTPTSDATSD